MMKSICTSDEWVSLLKHNMINQWCQYDADTHIRWLKHEHLMPSPKQAYLVNNTAPSCISLPKRMGKVCWLSVEWMYLEECPSSLSPSSRDQQVDTNHLPPRMTKHTSGRRTSQNHLWETLMCPKALCLVFFIHQCMNQYSKVLFCICWQSVSMVMV